MAIRPAFQAHEIRGNPQMASNRYESVIDHTTVVPGKLCNARMTPKIDIFSIETYDFGLPCVDYG